MSNVCACPKPPGGTVTCSDKQLAICGYQDGEIVSGCFDRPTDLQSMRDHAERTLALANWAISVITGTQRLDGEVIETALITMMRSGQYVNEDNGEVIKFVLPSDLDLQQLARATSERLILG